MNIIKGVQNQVNINGKQDNTMPTFLKEDNSALVGRQFQIPRNVLDHLNTTLSTYGQYSTSDGYKRLKSLVDNTYNDRKGKKKDKSTLDIQPNTKYISYHDMKRIKHDFDSMDRTPNNIEYILNGGQQMMDWVNNELTSSRNAVKDELYDKRQDTRDKNAIKPSKSEVKPLKLSTGDVYVHESKNIKEESYFSVDELDKLNLNEGLLTKSKLNDVVSENGKYFSPKDLDEFVLSESYLKEELGISKDVEDVSKKVFDKIFKQKPLRVFDEFVEIGFFVKDIGFIGHMYVSVRLYKDNTSNGEATANSQDAYVEDDKLHNVDLDIGCNYGNNSELISLINHEIKHLYDAYINLTKRNKEGGMTDLYNSNEGNQSFLNYYYDIFYLANDEEMRAYTQQSYRELEQTKDYKNTSMYVAIGILKDSLKKLEADSEERIEYFTSVLQPHVNKRINKKYLEDLIKNYIKKYERNLGRIWAKHRNEVPVSNG
jgi:hypothetical protein